MSKINTPEDMQNHLHTLANQLTREMDGAEAGAGQKEQLELLMKLEDKFRKSILKTSQAKEIYKKFVLYIVADQRNRLLAKPYFRERNDAFNNGISEAIKTGNIKKLQTYHINFLLISFIKENWRGPMPEKTQTFYDKIKKTRNDLIVSNLPQAINQAKIFFRKTPESHLSLSDMVGYCSAGLISGVDKWSGPYSKVWRSTCIAYGVGFMIDAYSKTQIHMSPSDRATLYRINSIRFKSKSDDEKVISHLLNKEFPNEKARFDSQKISILLSAANVSSTEAPVDQDESDRTVFVKDYIADAKADVEDSFIENDASRKMIECIRKLPYLNQKILRLKGIKL